MDGEDLKKLMVTDNIKDKEVPEGKNSLRQNKGKTPGKADVVCRGSVGWDLGKEKTLDVKMYQCHTKLLAERRLHQDRGYICLKN